MSEQMLISVLVWAACVLATAFLALLTWVALRIVSQGEKHTEQLDVIKGMVREELHKHDIRIVRLEERAGVTRRASDYHEVNPD